RPRLLAARKRRHGAQGRIFQAGRTHIPIRDLLPHSGVLDRRTVLELERARKLEELRHIKPTALPAADREAFVHQRRQRDLPALPNFTDALRIGNLHIGEEYLIEPATAARL